MARKKIEEHVAEFPNKSLSKRHSKKAQMIGEIFVFILAGFVFVLILLYGYKAITSFLGTQEVVQVTDFKTDLEAKIKGIRLSFGSVRKAELTLPAKFTTFCVADPHMSEQHKNLFREEYPLMYNAWADAGTTAFLEPVLDTGIQLPDIAVHGPTNPADPGFLCEPIRNGKLVLGLRGLGDRAEIMHWSSG